MELAKTTFPGIPAKHKKHHDSALANVTNGGDASVLTSDLKELNSAITSHSYQAILKMDLLR